MVTHLFITSSPVSAWVCIAVIWILVTQSFQSGLAVVVDQSTSLVASVVFNLVCVQEECVFSVGGKVGPASW